MRLALDLSASEAKIARAREHFESLKRVAHSAIGNNNPYDVRLGNVDPNGWVSVFFAPTDFSHYPLGVIIGDVLSNLRCALDYIVTALVDKSGSGTLKNTHQFPIFIIESDYRGKVGDPICAKPKGPLASVVHGLSEIWDLQPFQRKPDPTADLLHVLNWLSNADKHRQIIAHTPYFSGDSKLNIVHNGTIIEQQTFKIPDSSYREHEVARLRFGLPYPTQINVDFEFSMRIRLTAQPFGKHSPTFQVTTSILEDLCNHVAMITNLFKNL